MTFRHFILATILGCAFATGLMAQAALGFTNLNGFPDVLTQGTQYSISGWVVNNGVVPLAGNVRIEMTVNLGSVQSIDNNFNISTPLAPGDSIYWSKANHTFPPGQFRLGHNDVLIWPTMPVFPSAEIDSLEKPMIFTESSAMKLLHPSFSIFDDGIDLDQAYTFDAVARNMSSNENSNAVSLYVVIPFYEPIIISSTFATIQPGADWVFQIRDLEISSLFQFRPSQLPTNVMFYVLEEQTTDPVNVLDFQANKAVSAQNAIDSNDGVAIFPNPSQGNVQISMPDAWKANANLSVFSMQGQRIFNQEKVDQGFSLPTLAAGNYLFVLQSSKGKHQEIVNFR